MKVLLELDQVEKSYGAQVLFDRASVKIGEGQKIGFIGRNGAGKSTLCRLILGQEELDGGRIHRSRDLRLSYLEQHNPFQPEETVLAFLARYTGCEEWQCGKLAGRFQIKNEILTDTPIGSLSGGYQTRVKLTAMLLRDPNFLILDEPTNFLDLQTLLLLEQFFQDFRGGFLIVSHDREFLKKTCEETLEAERGDLTLYPGDVEAYFSYKAEQQEQAEHYNRNVEAKQKQLQEFVDRFRAKASKAAQAQSKLKQLQNLETIEIAHPMSNVRIHIPGGQTEDERNSPALRIQGLAAGYGEKRVVKDVSLTVSRGAHIAVLGENGQGKTTLLRTLAQDLPPVAGTARWGEGVRIGYYAQHVYGTLAGDQTIEQYLQQTAARDVTRQDILAMAGSFLFRGSDVDKPIRVLSGGERARLVLAGLLLAKHTALLLDEPTNHLDFETVEALAQALRTYRRTVLLVSHDRTFVNLVATQILEVKNGEAHLYPDSYESYVASLQRSMSGDSTSSPRSASKESGVQAPKESASKEDYSQRKAQAAQRRKQEKELRDLESRLETLGAEKASILKAFQEDAAAYSRERAQRLQDVEAELARTEERWLALQETLQVNSA